MAETKEGGVYLAADGKTRIDANGRELKAAAKAEEKTEKKDEKK